MAHCGHICGFYYVVDDSTRGLYLQRRKYLPQVDMSVHSTVLASTSRTTLTQRFVNPLSDGAIRELRYTFPLYESVSVVGFTCTINRNRVIRGAVKERQDARRTYDDAIASGETAGLLEQLPDASDLFTTTVGNVPPDAEIKVDITYVGELKHDAEGEGSIRLTIPTCIAPRYGDYPGELVKGTNVSARGGIKITVDAEMPGGSNIQSIRSPSHPISITIGNTSAGVDSGADVSLQKASATLSLATAELDRDFVLQIVAVDTGKPIAVLETHPTLSNHRAIMATLVPRFNLPASRPEIVFVCDRSGSMGSGQRIPHLKAALQIFLKSLPLGVKFNICSFGSHHGLLFDNGSVSYDAASVEKATKYVDGFAADHGGTEMYQPLEDVFQRRHKDMDLEVFLLTDGEVWRQQELIGLVNSNVNDSSGAIRVFTLGIGNDVSHALVEGLARAGNGFSQTVMDNEKMNTKVLRMLKAALTPHILDYNLEIKYQAGDAVCEGDEADFEIVEKVMDALTIDIGGSNLEDKGSQETVTTNTISLFDPDADPDTEMKDVSRDTSAGGRYSGLPAIPEPKFLQAPFRIPPLYPFSRISVYLLLAPESTQKTPESVVLRGTSAHGPLELEIPITILSEAGETVHQLAARKAIRELEDGRGWIFHARDSGDGKLLKDRFPGRFPDMVEREAVRLGVKFQVGGKWCSFVAVDRDESKSSKTEIWQDAPDCSRVEGLTSLMADPLYGRGGATGPPTAIPLGNYPQPAQPTPMMAAPTTISRNMVATRSGIAMGGFPSARASAKRPSPKAKRARPVTQSFSGDIGYAMQTLPDIQQSPKARPNDPFETVVALQSFDGYWAWTDELLGVLEVDGEAICLHVKACSDQAVLSSGSDLSTKSDKLATAVVLAWLERKMQERKDEWEMMADKAYQWLESTLPDRVASSYVSIVRDMVAHANTDLAA